MNTVELINCQAQLCKLSNLEIGSAFVFADVNNPNLDSDFKRYKKGIVVSKKITQITCLVINADYLDVNYYEPSSKCFPLKIEQMNIKFSIYKNQ